MEVASAHAPMTKEVLVLKHLFKVDDETIESLQDVSLGGEDEKDGKEPLTVTNLAEAINGSGRGDANRAGPARPIPMASPEEILSLERLEIEIRSEQFSFRSGADGTSFEMSSSTVRISIEEAAFRARSGDTQVEASASDVSISVDSWRLMAARQSQPVAQSKDPIMIDLDGDGYETTGVESGMVFDIDADGKTDRVSTVTGGDAFLAWDRNGNGTIDDGGELFGDHHGAADGIAELASHDDNGDNRIDASDTIWSRLSLWDGSNLRSLQGAGFTAIDLGRTAYSGTTSGGDSAIDQIAFERGETAAATATDAYLQYM